jgi:hypothetical protein
MPSVYPNRNYYLYAKQQYLYSSEARVSKEGLKIGDLIYFSDSNSKRPANLLVKMGNNLAFKSHRNFYQNIPSIYNTFVHAELVVDIDNNGYAIIAGAPGPNEVMRNIKFLDYLQSIQDRKLSFNQYVIIRSEHQALCTEVARQMQICVGLDIAYSRTSCVLTMMPRALKSRSTIDSDSMMCQEVIFNVLDQAIQNLKWQYPGVERYLPPKLKAQVTPGLALFELLQTGLWGASQLHNSEVTSKQQTAFAAVKI